MNYQTIYTIKESEKATVLLAAVELYIGPVIVKKIKGGKPDIYRLLCEKSHPNISQILSVEEAEDGLLVAEEYVDGENLAGHLQKHYLSDDEKINLALQLCDAVGFLHAMKPSIIHRDIKPSNILITEMRMLKLIDFDASRLYKDAPSCSDTRLLGTVEYAPPEQFGYSQTDVRSDIYSMGVVFHEMRPTENKRLTALWEKLSEKCTSFDPKNRYQSVAELKREIEKLAAWKKRRKKKIIAGVCGIAVLCIAGVLAVSLWPKKNQAEEVDGVVPTPTIEATLTPEPTETPTLVPTETPTPEPTEKPTPEQEDNLTLSPVSSDAISEDVRVIVLTDRENSYFIDDFYKGLDANWDFMVYSTFMEGEKISFTSVKFQNVETMEMIEVPTEQFYKENNILHIKNSFMQTLDITCYRVDIDFVDEATGHRSVLTTHVLLHSGDNINPQAQLFANSYLDFYYEYNSSIHTMLSNDVDGRFVEGGYRLLEDGRVIEMDAAFLMQYMEPGNSGTVEFELALKDGRTGKLIVNYLPGKPDYAQ